MYPLRRSSKHTKGEQHYELLFHRKEYALIFYNWRINGKDRDVSLILTGYEILNRTESIEDYKEFSISDK